MFKEKINENKKEMPMVLTSSLGASIYGFFKPVQECTG
jgi:hypothetical protein